ncbi:MAG: UDP-N-acetylmuramate dehydrogenase [Candidatus Latescibacteria bacterium]|nr:UDP-N-acetylmuramate dehydrogenase [Candidatus Latescibacterota bacterium]
MVANWRQNVPLAPLTSLQLGGPARYLAVCQDVDDIRAALEQALQMDLPVQILGGGSNTLFADGGFPGLVLHIAIAGIDFKDEKDATLVSVGAGEDWDNLVQTCIDRNLGGLECLSGIPGRVGATPIQNVGAYGQEVKDTLATVEALDRETLELTSFSNQQCRFAYRQSRFKAEDRDRYIITRVVYRLPRPGRPTLRYPELRRYIEEGVDLQKLAPGREVLQTVRQAVLQLRRAKSMVLDPADPDSRSAGSFFLNPVIPEEAFHTLQAACAMPVPSFPAPQGVKIPAAWLVEQAGFAKGYSLNGAGISSKHALALVNRGGSTSDLLALANSIRSQVQRRFGILLEREPVLVDIAV